MSNQHKFSADSSEGRNFAYELAQKLTYYIVTAELVFCGYLLLNADKLNDFSSAPYLFVSSGIAAISGLLWRFCYNITYHTHAHTEQSLRKGYFESKTYKAAKKAQSYLHNSFAVISVISMIWILVSGFIYIRDYKLLHPEHKEALAVKENEVKPKPNVDEKPCAHSSKKVVIN